MSGYIFSKGTITSLGILLNDRYYSCPRAIKYCWFDRDSKFGIEVSLVHNELDGTTYIFVEGHLEEVYLIANSMKVTKGLLNQYYKRIERLKDERRKIIRKRRVRRGK